LTIYGVHGVGVFLPWHRYAIWTFESVLRSECNYTGAQPYWDWTLDNPRSNGSILTSPVVQAFGGDGSADTGCVQNGPFNSSTYLNIGPVESLKNDPRCLKRSITALDFDYSSEWEFIYPPTMSRKNHVQLQAFIDGLSFIAESDKASTGALQNPHSMGHAGIGYDVSTRNSDSGTERLIVISSRTSTRHPMIPSSGCTIQCSITYGLCGKRQTRHGC